jgi:hypothetical protein
MKNAFHNQSTADLVDEAGNLDAQIKRLEKQFSAIKGELKSRKVESCEGQRFAVTVTASERVTYDDKSIREILGEDAVAEFKRVTSVETMRFSAVAVFDQSQVAA